ncbi:hypothetical protein LEP1GSC020_0609 [Leptospira interrogans serovar Grippotyphosa str. 2006006986]|uniref:Uncharacterized protein n=2 Tax=Leptospira interrogans TaxID=173 RepID=A0A0M3TML7_LEPIR|nr:hypothetical protein G436_3923 [Leptospira interrogans serovar Hardjo str. Norma]APH42818.1 Uncharacterized protein A9P81_3278 [Leptospira interrogans serovar Copenhageni/Icterohaemorrhagiae]EJP04705.1 hypothetical protein LEP1GSC007_0867 [Leptospira interrogans serovar Bulgarica str. Mallika]EKO89536.1 hypothetical protein LEP1GSC009_4844 [Leptospira interrogans serovar Grippotyphosa str. Andaman]EKP85018.1 hypothetical protein LEP1GSC020_0609 [Leptospira interrogans serovar Grippotyphosa s
MIHKLIILTNLVFLLNFQYDYQIYIYFLYFMTSKLKLHFIEIFLIRVVEKFHSDG